MGLLDQIIGGVAGQVLGGNNRSSGRGGTAPIVQALLTLLLSRGGAGGLGGLLGGDRGPDRDAAPVPEERDGTFDANRRTPEVDRGREQGSYGDLSGMLDGPGDRSPGAGPYAGLDEEPGQGGRAEAGQGFDGLLERLQRGGLGDVVDSWVGSGTNRPVEPNRLADALGSDTVNDLSRRSGLDRDALVSQLASVLPGVIDALTPQGRRPGSEERRGW